MRGRMLGGGDLFEVGEDLCDPVEAGEPNSSQGEAAVLGAGEAQRSGGGIGLARSERAAE